MGGTRAPRGKTKTAAPVPRTAPARGSLAGILWALVSSVAWCGLCAPVAAPFWVLTQSLALVYGRPPKLVYVSQTVRYLGYVWKERREDSRDEDSRDEDSRQHRHEPEQPRRQRLSAIQKIGFTATILVHTMMSPLYSFAWILDEILYGRKLSNLGDHEQDALDNALFVVSAYRSASTTMARGLVERAETETSTSTSARTSAKTSTKTPYFVAPNAMMCAYPYLWLWNLVCSVAGDIPESDADSDADASGITRKDVREKFNSGFTPDSLARHPNDPFAVDTFDGTFLSCHLNGLAWRFCGYLPESVIAREFDYSFQEETDALNQRIWKRDMVDHIDRLARKTLLFHGGNDRDSDRSPPRQRFLLKGHFLSVCPRLAERFSSRARFLTVLRDPCQRLRSGINHTAVNPTLYASDDRQQIPWRALAKVLHDTEARYCDREMEWFGGGGDNNGDRDGDDDNTDDNTDNDNDAGLGPRRQRMAIAFDSFVGDPDKTMNAVIDWLGREEGDGDGSNERGRVVLGHGGGGNNNNSNSNNTKNQPRAARRNKNNQAQKHRPRAAYRIDRSLSELGIDEGRYRERLSGYLSWMEAVAGTTATREKKKDK